jgi:pimeloyl-ACP methyl ester carboxylesterase
MSDTATDHRIVKAGDGRDLEVLVSGPDDGFAVMIYMGTHNGLLPLPSQLDPGREGLRMIQYARPGYCASTPQPGRSVANAAADTAAILDALGVTTFVTVGWSGGGPPALACSAVLSECCLATAVMAGVGPYIEGSPEVRAWYETEDLAPALAGDLDAFNLLLEEQRVGTLQIDATDLPGSSTARLTAPRSREIMSSGSPPTCDQGGRPASPGCATTICHL